MAEEPYVSVRGDAVLEVDPELARVAVTVSARDKARARAMALLQDRSERVVGGVRDFGDAVEDIETAAVRIHLQYRDNKSRERIEGYIAQVTYTVTVSDFAVLGDLITRLAEDDAADVAGPWWSLRRDSDVYRRARVAAVEEAVQRARQYAGALGARLTGLLHLADTGLLGEPPSPFGVAAAMPLPPGAPARGPAEPPVLQLEPARQVVRAMVEARFTMSAPDLSAI